MQNTKYRDRTAEENSRRQALTTYQYRFSPRVGVLTTNNQFCTLPLGSKLTIRHHLTYTLHNAISLVSPGPVGNMLVQG